MNFKAKVYLNRIQIDYLPDFAKATDYFKRHGVDISFEFVNSNYQNPEPEIFPLNVGYRILLPMNTVDPIPIDPTYDFNVFVFNQEEFPTNKMPTGRYYLYKNAQFIHIGTHRANPKDLTYVEICHELMHAITAKANSAGFQIPDQMDTYYNNFFLEMENSNFGQQWKLLEPYLKPPTPPTTNYFKVQEFVSKAIYQQWGDKAIWFVDPRIQKLMNFARVFWGKPIKINDWFWGGNLDQRGFREPSSTIGASLSQHRFKSAVDFSVVGMTSKQVYDSVLANEKVFMEQGLTTMENINHTPFHNHFDIRQTGLNNILIVNP